MLRASLSVDAGFVLAPDIPPAATHVGFSFRVYPWKDTIYIDRCGDQVGDDVRLSGSPFRRRRARSATRPAQGFVLVGEDTLTNTMLAATRPMVATQPAHTVAPTSPTS